MDALQRLDEILNKIPAKPTPAPTQSKRVTFEATTKPPQEQQPAAPRVANETPTPRVINEIPTPRVTNATPTQRMSTTRQPKVKATIDKPILTKERRIATDDTPGRTQLKEYLRTARDNRARIPQRHRTSPRRHNPTERIQLIHDAETGEYLNYRQLMRSPKHKVIWSKSSANKFGQLAQGLKDGRVKGTNTIKFIRKNQIPHDRRKDVTYGSFSCDMKPNKTEIHRTRLTAGGDRINYPEDVGTPMADPCKQHYFDTRSKMHNGRHQRFLFEYSNETT